ncbi:MAG: methyltransferase domain-containing protein [Chryseolinea sp.]
MELKTAINLIRDGVAGKNGPGIWADLGAGTGLFSKALGECLPVGSSVYAVDRDARALDSIPWNYENKTLIRMSGDIEKELVLPPLDGILIANALHYISSQSDFMKRQQVRLRDAGVFIIVEYDTTKGNQWVPHPISFNEMKKLAASIGCAVKLLGTVPSKFNTGDLYSVLLNPLH